MSKHYVHNIFTLFLIKQIFEKYKSSRAAPKNRTQFWSRITSVVTFFYCLVLIQSTYFLSGSTYLWEFFWCFFSTVVMITGKMFCVSTATIVTKQILSWKSCSLSNQTTGCLKHYSLTDKDYSKTIFIKVFLLEVVLYC